MYRYAFFDVDSLELAANGRTYVCHPNISSKREELYDAYTAIAHMSAPLIFTVDVDSKAPDETSTRRDFLSIPASKTEQDWRESAPERFKFFLNREKYNDIEGNAIFNNNQNTSDCIQLIKADQWIVFGNGLKHHVDHVITNLLEITKKVKFIPELIMPGSEETKEDLSDYFIKWQEKGASPITYNQFIALAPKK